MNRIKVKRSKLLRSLVRGGADRRQMVRQLSRESARIPGGYSLVVDDPQSAFLWSDTPQGLDFWSNITRQWRQGMGYDG